MTKVGIISSRLKNVEVEMRAINFLRSNGDSDPLQVRNCGDGI
jgi:hypothetical protein